MLGATQAIPHDVSKALDRVWHGSDQFTVLLTLWNRPWRPCEIPSICLSICLEFFSKTACSNFLTFCMRLLKEWGSWIFWKKIILGCLDQMSPKWVQNEVFHVSWKINAWNFSNLLHEVIATQSLKIDLDDNFRKILFRGFGL